MSLVRLCCEQTYDLKPEEKEKLAAIWGEKIIKEQWFSCEEKIVDINDIPDWCASIKQITIKPLHTIKFVHQNAPTLSQSSEIKEFLKTVNQIVMPGFDLLNYGAIKVCTDECTNQIQADLDEGWRIIAVLPQPNQRRPDYILVRAQKP
jgi:hypothetical protein